MALISALPVESGSLKAKYNNVYIALVCIVAALGGLLFGFDLVIISGAVPFFSENFQLNALQQGQAVGCINLGAALGALLGGRLSNKWGRKKLLIVCAVLFAVTGIATGWATSFFLFIIFRICSGVAMGAAALVCPMYIAEIAPASFRGRLVAFYQLAIVIGLLLAYLTNYFLLGIGTNNWRWMFSSQAIPALLFFTGLFFVPESPRWLVSKGKENEAHNILEKTGGNVYAAAGLLEIKKSFENTSRENWKELFRYPARRIVFIGAAIAVFSQIDGQNSVLSYAPEIFKQSGALGNSAFLQSVMIGVIFFIFTFLAIATVDKAGRRKILLYGSLLLFATLGALAACFYLKANAYVILFFVLAFAATYAASLGPVTWVIVSELFPNHIRGAAMSVATLALWIANYITVSMFPVMQENFGLPVTFLIHAVICLFLFVFVLKYVPETKQKTLEEIEKFFKK